MKTAEEKQNEINSLSKRMRELQNEIKQDISNKYKHLIGVCFNVSDNTYLKITSIEDVYEQDITVEGVKISLIKDISPLRFDGFSIITEKFIIDNQISKARFSALFDMVVERLKEDYGINYNI